MQTDIIQNMLDITFKFFVPYLSPLVFLFMILQFSNGLIGFFKKSINLKIKW